MRLTKPQVTGLFEFPQNTSSLSDILKGELGNKKKGEGKTKRRRRKERTTRKNKKS